MKKDKEEKDTQPTRLEDEDEFHICPECDGTGHVVYKGSFGKELCMLCDGLGIVYED